MIVAGDTPPSAYGATLEVYRNGNTSELLIHQDDGTATTEFAQLHFRNGGNDTYIKTPTSGQALIIDTESVTDAVGIRTDGRVGIGTITPDEKLEIEGTGELSFKINNTQYTRSLTITQGGGYSHLKTSHSSGVAINYGQGNAGILSLFNNTTQAIKINANGDSYFNGGNVGIGTTSPSKKLHVVGSQRIDQSADWDGLNIYGFDNQSSDYLKLHIGTTPMVRYQTNLSHNFYVDNSSILQIGATAIGFKVNTSYGDDLISIFGTNKDSYIGYSNTDNRLKIGFGSTSGPTVDSNTKLSLDASGVYVTDNLGIGTTSPAEKLHVNGDVRVDGNDGVATKKIRSSYFSSTQDLDLIAGSSADIILTSDKVGIGTSSPSAKLDIEGDLQVKGVNISNQENLDVDTGTETIATVVKANYDAAFFDFVIKNGTNLRAGTVFAIHDGTNVEFTETSTNDLGDTSAVTLAVDISGTDMRLRATTTSDNWIIKSLVRTI